MKSSADITCCESVAVCSGALSPALVMTDDEVKRQQHIRELIDTEDKYVKDLDIVIEVSWCEMTVNPLTHTVAMWVQL